MLREPAEEEEVPKAVAEVEGEMVECGEGPDAITGGTILFTGTDPTQRR